MAVIESLKKITYDSLTQFVEDINANFAIIQNSPLYKGIPGDQGDPGKSGLTGERGSHFYFVKLEKFIEQYPESIVNGTSININWINVQLKASELDRKKLLNTLGVIDSKFVNNDIVVLTNSEMIEYDVVANQFVPTGISFYQQGSLVTSIETRIQEYVKLYVDNNPIINSLENIFVKYTSYNQLYSETANTYITNKESDAGLLIPSITGESLDGTLVNKHKYFGYNRNIVESGKQTTTVFGSIDDYVTLLNDSISVVKENNYTSDYTPNINNIPTMVVLQNTTNNGILFGCKKVLKNNELKDSNIAYFGSIFKDENRIVHIKSDQGKEEKDFSELLLHRNYFRYNKQVIFNDDLIVGKDFHLLNGNFNNKWFRTAEFIKTKYSNSPLDLKQNVFEIGLLESYLESSLYDDSNFIPKLLNGKDIIYRNLFNIIELPAFAVSNKRVILTVEPVNKRLCNDYAIETKYTNISDLNENNLNDITWTPSNNITNHIVTSKHINELISKINYIQKYIKENYWRRDEWQTSNRTTYSENNRINLLNLNKLDVFENTILGAVDNNYFTSDIENKTLTIGFETDGNLLIHGKKITLYFYSDLTNTNSGANIVTTNNSGILTKEYGILNNYNNIDLNYFINRTDNNSKYLLPTVAHLGLLAKSINTTFTNYWKKEDFTKNANPETGEDNSNPLGAGNIPNLFVQNLLGGKYLNISFSTRVGSIYKTRKLLFDNNNGLIDYPEFKITGTKLILDEGIINIPELEPGKFVLTDNDKNLISDYEIFNNNSSYKDITGSEKFTITDANKKLLTATDFIWINNRINEHISKVVKDYYTKNDFAPNTNEQIVIPTLYLNKSFKLTGTEFTIGPKSNEVIQYDGISLKLGEDLPISLVTDKKLELLAPNIYFNKWSKSDIDKNELDNKVLVTNKNGLLLKTYFISNSPDKSSKKIILNDGTESDEIFDTEVPEYSIVKDKLSKDKSNQEIEDDERLKEIESQTQNEHHIITGKQWKWLQTFIKFVKERFANTFNKEETIDYVYDHMPIGSIIMWTKKSADLYEKSYGKNTLKNNGIPKGWVICDGHKENDIEIPDLKDKFVRGIGNVNDASGEGGSNTITIERKHLPNLTHSHNCEDDFISHKHDLKEILNSGNFKLNDNEKIWSNKNLNNTQNFSDYVNRTGANAFNKFDISNLNKNNFEIPLVYKKTPEYNYFQECNYKHIKDDNGSKNTWRRYDLDATRDNDATIISANLTTIFRNFCSNFKVEETTLQVTHTIEDFNIGTGDNSNIKKQEEISIIPEYYKVVYIMKIDTRIENSTEYDSRYKLV